LPELEWPGSGECSWSPSTTNADAVECVEESPNSASPCALASPLLRLLTLQSSLHRSCLRTHALLSPYPSTQLGRDNPPPGSVIPRIRLKEMLVSKVHATIYYDESERKGWCIVDMGSLHGTFLRRSNGVGEERLSPPRTASLPRVLKHLDLLKIGSTTFVVHVHEDGVPCVECSPVSVEDEIPLFPPTSLTSPNPREKRYPPETGADSELRDVRKALSSLKRSLLTPGRGPGIREGAGREKPSRYIDRSARRRAFHPTTHPDSPGVRTPTTFPVSTLPYTPTPLALEPVSQPPTPIPKANIGHRLLLKQGWEPGTSLGLPADDDERVRLVEPLKCNVHRNRAGLGAGTLRM
jgi:pSer/pThr/pTyr-binding forkhead associated (FHA) protein